MKKCNKCPICQFVQVGHKVSVCVINLTAKRWRHKFFRVCLETYLSRMFLTWMWDHMNMSSEPDKHGFRWKSGLSGWNPAGTIVLRLFPTVCGTQGLRDTTAATTSNIKAAEKPWKPLYHETGSGVGGCFRWESSVNQEPEGEAENIFSWNMWIQVQKLYFYSLETHMWST